MSVRIGNIDFESATYYAEGDVLYLHNGSPSDAVDFDGSPEGHHTRFNAAGNLVGITIVNARYILDLEGVISADRRYVTMNVNFSVSDDLKFRDIPVQGAAGGGDIGGGRASTFTGVIQLPEINVTSVATTASVPDKGTMLLGGQRRFKEFEVESGIPVLSKIPIVNRFFTNRIDSEEELSTVILIRPEIVIQQENEDELFPGLSEQIGSMGG